MEDLEEANLVEPNHSYCAAPSILVKTKGGTFRPIVEYRGLNKQIEKNKLAIAENKQCIRFVGWKRLFFEYRPNIRLFPNGLRGGITKLDCFHHSYGFL